MQKRVRRRNLMREDPHCWYCGRDLVFVEVSGGQLPEDYPTIEHLFSRYSGRISINTTNELRRVLACPKCNNDRARWEEALVQAGEQIKKYGI